MAHLPPAYLFVVRHGNRLDAADKKWHLTSPTPYDPPLTYGGFLQGRQVGNQIMAYLEQAKMEASNPRRKRFKVVIHTSPFLRCVQTSIGISSGLAQTSPDSPWAPSDIIVPRAAPTTNPPCFKSSLLRIDSFLGEWLSPEYFEMITPPPGPALMLGGAKADLLRREDYSIYLTAPKPPVGTSHSLWQASPSPSSSPAHVPHSPSSDGSGTFNLSGLTSSLPPSRSSDSRGYVPFRPMYAVSSSGKIPEGFVAHARDSCLTVDYQWDSMRAPLDFGDGGKFGEEWTAMHRRFRGGVEKLVNWYATAEAPADLVVQAPRDADLKDDDQDEVETVVILVSHGAGCNALIGAITHQPVLMDVGIASITMATRKSSSIYAQAVAAIKSKRILVRVDELYDMRLSASTDHLHSTSSTPVSSRSTSVANLRNASINGSRGRTWTLGSSAAGPTMSSFVFSDPLSSFGSRSTSASAASSTSVRRDSAFQRSLTRSVPGGTLGTGGLGAPGSTPSLGLWSPMPSSLRLMDDGGGGDNVDDLASMLPNFDQKRFESEAGEGDAEAMAWTSRRRGSQSRDKDASTSPASSSPPSAAARLTPARGPILAAPIKLQTSLAPDHKIEEVKMSQFGGGLGGLWGLPPPPDEAERFRDLSQTKRRWTVNERA
ncbi:hypothetical protein CDD82_6961 [Ophiocordyceps australis]|uniref:Phosphoglycerate mutase n=1 Tax=Ophiocordyceps australis TaxID=1399860 RepID=A0A2C5YMH7_9HYPO|nr:hypothetical protein CDD82_6961 [Ophiocordyceps australis]